MRTAHPGKTHLLEIGALPPAVSPATTWAHKPHATETIRSVGQHVLERASLPFTVLCVDDKDDLRRIMQITLNIMGFDVISCPEAESASAAFRASSAVDLLITDLEMPGRSGLELARELCTLPPSLPVLIVSGALYSQELQDAVRQGAWRFLAKPYAVPTLFAHIQTLLGGKSRARAQSL